MNKQEFLEKLRVALRGLPEKEIEDRVSFYSEMICDRIEEGVSEEEAVAGIGPIDAIVSQTVADIPIAKLVKERIKPKRALSASEIALIVLGFPLWFPLLIAAASVILAIYAVFWSIIVSLWAVVISLAAGAIGGGVIAIVYFAGGNAAAGLAITGAALICAGITVFSFRGALLASKGIILLTQKCVTAIKNKIIRKESR